jgi:hypothetical protein
MRDELLPNQPRPIEKRRVRFDKVSRGPDAPRAESRSLLGLFRFWGEVSTPERRRLPRHEVVESQVWLGWVRGSEGFRATSALIVNLSRGGAFIFLDEKPPKDQPVWLSQGIRDPAGSVEARVVAAKVSRQGQCAVRLEFREPCPYSFFGAAVCGMAPSDPRRRNRHSAGSGAEGEPAPRS